MSKIPSDTYYRERCGILEEENEKLKTKVRKLNSFVIKNTPCLDQFKCDGDNFTCDNCKKRHKFKFHSSY